jgi:hypothetical protein
MGGRRGRLSLLTPEVSVATDDPQCFKVRETAVAPTQPAEMPFAGVELVCICFEFYGTVSGATLENVAVGFVVIWAAGGADLNLFAIAHVNRATQQELWCALGR